MDFERLFSALTGNSPFPWQCRLYERFCCGEIPVACDIPTGLGKTSVIAVWLLALAGKRPDVQIPRRLVYVVNRRTIVDQSTDVVVSLQGRLREAEQDTCSVLNETAEVLKAMSVLENSDGEIVSVSTLRGELADNLKWRFDPIRPSVMIGTVDMIGSKLLFSGYGDTRRTRPLNAGLVGCDTLIVHDESHLTPAFSQLLWNVESFSRKVEKIPGIPPFRILELSATSRRTEGSLLKIDRTDYDNDIVKSRYFAEKRLHLYEVATRGDVTSRIVDLSLDHLSDKTRVVVFIQSPEDATRVQGLLVEEISKREEAWAKEHGMKPTQKNVKNTLASTSRDRVSILTGEIRGYERDKLLETDGMLPFTGKAVADHTVYLVSTSAGEVGMDLHADHMVSDLSTLDSMIQRLGRANRFGQISARIDVVYEASIREKKNKDEPRRKTLEFLEQRMSADGNEPGLQVSPAELNNLLNDEAAADALSKTPDMVEATDILLDLWSQTSLMTIPARPEVAPWLHGIQMNLPETWIAWRQELSLLGNSELTNDEIVRWFQKHPISSAETLRKPSTRLKLTGTAEKKWIEKNKECLVFVLYPNGSGQRMTIQDMADKYNQLNYATVIFPTQLGGLNGKGFFDIKVTSPATDVADTALNRIILERFGDKYRLVPIDLCEKETGLERAGKDDNRDGPLQWTTLRDAVRYAEKIFTGRAVIKLKFGQASEWEDEPRDRWLILLKETGSGRSATTKPHAIPSIDEHNREAAEMIKAMAEATGLPAVIQEALFLAADHHDIGKGHARWQTAAGHEPGANLAKPGPGGVDWRILDGYRHELGSVMAALHNPVIWNHVERDLILHLIAVHHGWARPHFEDSAFPPETDEETRNRINLDVMMRFIKLQERFGYWQLAWLESLLRRADGIASMLQDGDEEVSDE